MFARVTRLQVPPDQLDAGVRLTREETIPDLHTKPGYKGSYWLADRQAGKAMSIILWESEEAVRADDAAASDRRAQASRATSATIQGTEVYEILIVDETR